LITIREREFVQTLKPKHLKKGDTVGIVAPSSPPFEEGDIEFTLRWLDKLGLKYKVGKHVFDCHSDYAGTDAARLEDFHAMWADDDVKAVLPIRGGNGSVRLLPQLDFELINKHPKILVGYSDITGLLIPIHQTTGLVTFHGPTAGSFFDHAYSQQLYKKALMKNEPLGTIEDPERDEDEINPQYPPSRLVIAEGKAAGLLTGGCLTLIRQLMGTPWEIVTKDKIVFLEDVQEEPHSIDRMLTQLLLAGKLKDAAGIIIGDCVRCVPGASRRNSFSLNYSLERVLRDRLDHLGIPVVFGLKLGHSIERMTLPLGVMASLSVHAKETKFKITESATE
jgi:muramoyltetrapeptide carboxypeptidase